MISLGKGALLSLSLLILVAVQLATCQYVTFTYNTGNVANNNTVMEINLKDGSTIRKSKLSNAEMYFQITGYATNYNEMKMYMLFGDSNELWTFDAKTLAMEKNILGIDASAITDIQFDQKTSTLYAIVQNERNYIQSYNFKTQQLEIVMTFNDTMATILGASTYDSKNGIYYVGGAFGKNNAIVGCDVRNRKIVSQILFLDGDEFNGLSYDGHTNKLHGLYTKGNCTTDCTSMISIDGLTGKREFWQPKNLPIGILGLYSNSAYEGFYFYQVINNGLYNFGMINLATKQVVRNYRIYDNFIYEGIRAQCPHAQSGLSLFSSLPQWNVQGADLVISTPVKVDQTASAVLRSITIANGGSLIFDDAILNLNVEFIKVEKGGKFIAGSADCPITKKITVTCYGTRTLENIIGSDPYDNTATGYKGIIAMSGATLQLHGAVNRPTWTNLAETVVKGSNRIKTIDATQWKVGDKIVLASTDFSEVVQSSAKLPSWMTGGYKFPDQNEERTIASVIDSRTFTVDLPFNYTHWGAGYQRAEVGILNRNIVFRGDNSSASQAGYGGHFMIRLLDHCEISGIEVTGFGQKGVMGRCIVVHDTNGLLVKNNVCFDSFGHQYFLEDGPENGNQFIGNLGIRARPVVSGDPQQLIPSDHDVSIFWITNPNNTYIGNAAVQAKFGFWYTMPVNPTGLSASTYGTTVTPRRLPLGAFINNTAHSLFTGLMVDDMEKPDGTTELASYSPPVETWFEGLIAYKNRDRGCWARGGPLGFNNFILMDNRLGFLTPPGPNILTNSLFVGESDNVGEVARPTIDLGGRSRPGLYSAGDIIKGHDTYDNGGPQYIKNVTFLNYVTNQYRKAGSLGQLMNAPFKHQSMNRYVDLKFDDATNRVYIHDQFNDANRGTTILDIDGSVTGRSPGGWIVANDTLLTRKGCTPVPLWQGHNCPVALEGYSQFAVVNLNGEFSTESDTGSYPDLNVKGKTVARMYTHDLTRGLSSSVVGAFSSDGFFYFHSNVLVRNFYAVRWAFNIPTPPALKFSLGSSANNEWIVFNIQYPRTAVLDITWSSYSQSVRQPMKKANNLQQILDDPTYYYYDSASENLFIHLKNRAGRTAFSERFNLVAYSFDGFNVVVNATCANNKCDVDDYSLPKDAEKFIKKYNREDRFAGVMQPCQIASSMTAVKGSGIVFAVLLPNRRTLDVTVHHDLSLIASKMSIGVGEPGSEEKFISQVGVKYSPYSMSRFSVDLSYDEIAALLKGKIFIKLHTFDYPDGHLRGQLHCNHGVRPNGHAACQVPLSISAAKPCDPVSNSFVFYTDVEQSIKSSYSIYGWSDTVIDRNFTAAPICGTSSIKTSLWKGGFQVSKSFKAGGPYNVVDLSVYKYFEFFVRGLSQGQTTLNIYFTEIVNDAAKDISSMYIDPKYIQHFKIDDSRTTRVRIPVADYPFTNKTSLNAVQRVGFVLNNQAQGTRELIFDNLRFVTGENDQLEDSAFDTAQIISFDKKWGICNAANVENPDLDPLNVRLTGLEVAEASAIIPSNSSAPRTSNATRGGVSSMMVNLLIVLMMLITFNL
ncbi:hypothetical protein NAEGRDRAFT_56847 [Naegleria gruberi]|uniref:G8 domain-containing protein n=1 Tax=Naegleria gruberi TaxID=5762 RepID=D2V169_NAEGR|nr:uncharacterized protein NAEGRDRAFT_56847 [Naegleria gruberi]EFC49255.1 hypothetical protein NAEGRDRAFT_56847 [Naegleria gruberi]|eukprot:XP_002681999.1 hypothetical protein NAEGRDRAFT_56847 [Naegleria gruberi strain NEG-M]